MHEDEYGQPIKELRIFSEEPPNILHLHELRKRFPEEDLPPDPRVSNMTTLWACKVISAMLDMGESRASPKIQSLLSLIAIELHWMKRNEREIERKMKNRQSSNTIREERTATVRATETGADEAQGCGAEIQPRHSVMVRVANGRDGYRSKRITVLAGKVTLGDL